MTAPASSHEARDILVVDDEECIRVGCSQILGKMGAQVRTVPNAEAALAAVRERCPDLIILDLKMPGMGGMEFLAHAQEVCPDSVVVVITGYATLESAVEAMKKGAYDFLPKPFTPDELKLVVGRGLERRHLALKAKALEREREMLRDSFAAVVSHQLRAPIAGAMQYMELIDFRFGDTVPEALKPALRKVSDKLQHLLQVVDKWQRFFKMGTTLDPADVVPVDLPALVRQAWETVLTKSSVKARLVLNADGAVGPTRGSVALLKELFANLFSNAIKYGGQDPEVTVQVRNEGPWTLVEVSDNGAGIPEEDLPRIFDCFFRGSGEAARKSPGLGIGLAIVKRVAEAHGGTVSVRSRLGEGTAFTVKLPLAQATAAAKS